jgi:hypothetical protein
VRYDSDPYIVKKILTEAETLHTFLSHPRLGERVSSSLLNELEPLTTMFLGTLDHFAQLHALNPQFSLSRFSANTIEQKLLSLRTSITDIFSLKQFESLREQAEWHSMRFLFPTTIYDNEQLLVSLYKKLAQVLETYYVDRVRKTQFAALLNEVVGWVEHIETHGYHDIHAVILFAEKIAKNRAIIEHRVGIVREICMLLQERSFLKRTEDSTLQQTQRAASELSRIYSSYLLELYDVLLEDMEIIAISEQDYHAFEQYCREHQIEVYEEYHDIIKNRLKKYVEGIAISIPPAFHMVKTANIIVNAELTYERYKEVETIVDILGMNLTEDIRTLQHAINQLEKEYPEVSQKYSAIMQKVKTLRKEIVKPAIQVYGQYIREPREFFEKLPLNQAEWIPILESAMACLEQDDDLYWKCYELKNRIDQFGLQQSEKGT